MSNLRISWRVLKDIHSGSRIEHDTDRVYLLIVALEVDGYR